MISYKRIYKASDAELISQKKTRIISIILLAFAGLIYGCGSYSKSNWVELISCGIHLLHRPCATFLLLRVGV